MSCIPFGAIGIDPLTLSQATTQFHELAAGAGGTVFTPNVHHAALAERDGAFAAAYRRAALCLCDGTPLRCAASMQARIPARIAGSAFLPLALAQAAKQRWRVAFVGGRPEVAAQLPSLLQNRYLGCSPYCSVNRPGVSLPSYRRAWGAWSTPCAASDFRSSASRCRRRRRKCGPTQPRRA